MTIIKKQSDHEIKSSPMCGDVAQILNNSEQPGIDIAMLVNMKTTTAHYHRGFTEVYLVLDGELELKYFDPSTEAISETTLGPNELAVFKPGVHHQVVSASEKNRLCVISMPRFDPADEHVSQVLI